MAEYPATPPEFVPRFTTEESCRDWLFQLRWPDGIQCPRLGHLKTWLIGGVP
ncbi:MAG: transposase [Planctomycetes bacterium]|nr:transposase [Planctomycetota bacterium]